MATKSSRSGVDLPQEIERALRLGQRTASELQNSLEVSQPTLSRTIRQLATVTMFRVAGDRTPRYALLRPLPLGLSPRQKIYRYLRTGHIAPFADVEFLVGGATLERIDGIARLYEGLPPYIAFAAPSGFLGRQLAHEAARTQGFPASLKDWGDDHRVAYLFTMGLNLPGNLVFGDMPLQREMQLLGLAPTPEGEKLEHYVGMATALRGATYGSSAGGEQPKFLWVTERMGHVIVKFAKLGSRMAELLPLEHLALRALGDVDVPASKTQLLAAGDYVFLEVQRFDRVGRSGRIGMLSAGAVDDEFFGLRDSWPEFAARCEHARYLTAEDARRVDVMAAFSELIGNSDRHFENISVLIGEDGEYTSIAPAYDILPMRYASIGGGLDPELTPIQPNVGTIGAKPEVWSRAAKAAEQFWRAAMTETLEAPLSREMRDLAQTNLLQARAFVAPLLPG
ncbi:MAG: HipA domain-containing protein [Paucibacter sp.]|nr:HipA domain-containing protein [Roseateles sp.]